MRCLQSSSNPADKIIPPHLDAQPRPSVVDSKHDALDIVYYLCTYIIIIVTSSSICFSLAITPKPKTLDHASLAKTLLFGFALD